MQLVQNFTKGEKLNEKLASSNFEEEVKGACDSVTEPPKVSPSKGIIYVGHTPGSACLLGKIGMAASKANLEKRVRAYRTADRIFSFQLEAAWEIMAWEDQPIGALEAAIHDEVAQRGCDRWRENFRLPGGSMHLLAQKVESILCSLGASFQRVDTSALQARASQENAEAFARLGEAREGFDPSSVYEKWITAQVEVPLEVASIHRPWQIVRDAKILGYALWDLVSGEGTSDPIRISLPENGELTIFPGRLEDALDLAKAEADLHLPSPTRFLVPGSPSSHPSPFSIMRILLGGTLEVIDVPGPFTPTGSEERERWMFSPDHLGALGLLACPEGAFSARETVGTRVHLPLPLYALIREVPALLPGVRFWRGLAHGLSKGCRFQDFHLPKELAFFRRSLPIASQALGDMGYPVAGDLELWVRHAWMRYSLGGEE